jgi:hypothetical protein
MWQQQAQTNHNIMPNKFSSQHPQMKEENLCTVAMRRPLAFNSWGKESECDLEGPLETEFSDLNLATTSLSQWQAKDGCLKFS